VIATREDWNRAYYGEDVRAVDILITGNISNPAADPLRDTVAKIDPPSE
jgi:lipid-binding SYLF domain-containing protein